MNRKFEKLVFFLNLIFDKYDEYIIYRKSVMTENSRVIYGRIFTK